MVHRKLSRPRRKSTGGAKPRIRGMEYTFQKKRRARSRPPLREAGCCCYSKAGKPCGNIISKMDRNSGEVNCWRHRKSVKHPKSSCPKTHDKYERCKKKSSEKKSRENTPLLPQTSPELPPAINDAAPPLRVPKIKLILPEYYTTLHSQGFVVLKNVFEIDQREQKEIDDIADKWAEVIFNPDNRRSQAPLTKPTAEKPYYENDKELKEKGWNNEKIDVYNEEVDEYNKDVKNLTTNIIPKKRLTIIKQIQDKIKQLFPNHTPNDMVVLRSDKNCKIQPAHADYKFKDLKKTGQFPKDHEMPLGVIVPLMEGSYIDVWPEAIGGLKHIKNKKIKPIRARMNPGDMLIFRGDTVHAGSSYRKYNIRIHTYADHPSVERDPNSTQPVDTFECIVPRRKSREDKSVSSNKSKISL